MYDFILQLSIFASMGVIIYLFARALPRINDIESPTRQPFSFFKWAFANLPLEKMDAAFAGFLEKNLRRLRVTILRVDNWLNLKINRIKLTNGNNRNSPENKSGLFKSQDSESKEV